MGYAATARTSVLRMNKASTMDSAMSSSIVLEYSYKPAAWDPSGRSVLIIVDFSPVAAELYFLHPALCVAHRRIRIERT